MDFLYLQKLVFKLAMVILIIGALNWFAIGAAGVNLVEKVLGRGTLLTRAIYILVGLSAFAVMFNRDTYLPFLGETVMPCSALTEQIPENADTEVEVKVPPMSKVLYWAAEPSTEKLKDLNSWKGAYLKYLNVGVVTANADGVATLHVRNPQPYKVPFKGRLEPHIHFRICSGGADGFLGRIKTVFLSDGHVEGFLTG
jgi:uncharacterized membrane protein YuzA (DUF378 family)